MSNIQSIKQENLFELIKSMSKAEKRNFKLYATRLSGNQDAKFILLFDSMDSMEEYDEAKILSRTPVKKEQLPNMKAHLYKQILKSIRLLDTQHSVSMQLHEQLDYARILYDKGLLRQSARILEKAGEQAAYFEQYAAIIDIMSFQKRISTMRISRSMARSNEYSTRQVNDAMEKIDTVNELSNTANQLYSLYLTLGYARTQKDLDLIILHFGPKLQKYKGVEMSFTGSVYYFQAQVWYNYIRHDMLLCYKYACRWLQLFDTRPQMKEIMYDLYIKGNSRLLEGLYMLRSYKRFVKRLERFEQECEELVRMNNNARMIALQVLYTQKMNRHFYEGTFSQGVRLVPRVAAFIDEFRNHSDIHYRMMLYYKIACMYFGNADYIKCNEYLSQVIKTRDPRIRRDLQCYARILHLISSYEAVLDHNIDYQARAVYVFLVKMNDMQQVQKELMNFLRRISSMYDSTLKSELRALYERLKPLEDHPYERRTFYYLDLISWLESKLEGGRVSEVIRRKFLKTTTAH